MNTTKLTILITVIATIGVLMAPPALAYPHGGGHHGGHYGGHGHWGHSYWGFGWWGPYYPFSASIVFTDSYYYPSYYPYYYPPVAVAPPVVVERPVAVRQDVTALPQSSYQTPVNYNGLEQIRQRKAQLLSQLSLPDKVAKLQAINELAGYSFDDQVKAALENILLSDPDAVMRIATANSFGKVKNQGALPVLEKVRVADSDREVREAADKAINQIKS